MRNTVIKRKKMHSVVCLLLALLLCLSGSGMGEEVPTPTGEVATPAPVTEAPVTEAPVTEAPVTEAPTAVPETPAPTTEAPTAVPETPAPTTEVPTAVPETPAPTTETPTATPTATEIPYEACTRDAGGTMLYGTVVEMIAACQNGGAIMLCSSSHIKISNFELVQLKDPCKFYFVPDNVIFSGSYEVVLSTSDALEDRLTQEDVDAALPGQTMDLFMWVRWVASPTDTPAPTDTPTPTTAPTDTPTPTTAPTDTPTPTTAPTDTPTPTTAPTDTPTPTTAPTDTPAPTTAPTDTPTPTTAPTDTPAPTAAPTDTPAPGPDPTRIPLPTGTPDANAVTLEVTADHVQRGVWSNVVPHFTLSGAKDNMTYAAIIYDETIINMDSNQYDANTEGVYTIRFAILNQAGDMVDVFTRYSLMIDLTPPEIVAENSFEKDYTISVYAADALSGVTQISTDGGQTWKAFSEGQTLTLVYTEKTVLSAGTIRCRDGAGNESVFNQELIADKISWGGGGGGGPTLQHVKETEPIAGPYDAYLVILPEGNVFALTLGGKEGNITLTQGGDDAPETLALSETLITIRKNEQDVQTSANALCLAPNLLLPESGSTCTWKLNGAEMTRLHNSGIQYLVLQVNDQAVVLPTAGMLAGTVYDGLKMGGIGSRDFAFTLTMPAFDNTKTLDFAVTVQDSAYSLLPGSPAMNAQMARVIQAESLNTPMDSWPETAFED